MKRTRRLKALLLIAAVGTASVVQNGAIAIADQRKYNVSDGSEWVASSKRDEDRHVDGKNLFAALAFGRGPLVEELSAVPALREIEEVSTVNSNTDQQRIIDELTDIVESNDPALYGNLSTKLRSGDPYKVESGLSDLTQALSSAVEEQENRLSERGYNVRRSISPSDTSIASPVVVVVAVFHAGAAVTGVVLAAVSVVYYISVKTKNLKKKTADQVQNEKYIIRDISRALEWDGVE